MMTNKLSGAGLLLIGVLIGFIGFTLYAGPVLANSSTATIVGGAANGNIFGSIQFDEINVTSTGVFRSDSGAGPSFLTVTYPTGLAWNSTWIHTGILANGIQMNGDLDFNGLAGKDANYFSQNGAEAQSGFIRMQNAAWIKARNAVNGADISIIRVTAADVIEVGTTFDGGSNAFNNLGAAGNDFGASNTLVGTTFSGVVSIGSNVATTGNIRLPNNVAIGWRNSTNTGDSILIYGTNSLIIQIPDGTQRLVINSGGTFEVQNGAIYVNGNTIILGSLNGAGNAYACLDAAGQVYRSGVACV